MLHPVKPFAGAAYLPAILIFGEYTAAQPPISIEPNWQRCRSAYLGETVACTKPGDAGLFESDFPAGEFLGRELIPIAGFSSAPGDISTLRRQKIAAETRFMEKSPQDGPGFTA
jgi:hypothetical protein